MSQAEGIEEAESMISCLWSVVYSEQSIQIFSLYVDPCSSVVKSSVVSLFHQRRKNAGRAPPAPDLLAPYPSPLPLPEPATALVAPLVLTLVLSLVERFFVGLEVASPVPLGEVSRMTVVAIVR